MLDELPERAVIVGAGYIALEFAGILNGMGVDTHVMFRGDKPLRGCARRSSLPACWRRERRGCAARGFVVA